MPHFKCKEGVNSCSKAVSGKQNRAIIMLIAEHFKIKSNHFRCHIFFNFLKKIVILCVKNAAVMLA